MTTLGSWEVNSVQNVDALTLLKGLPDESVHCIVTSPPYFGLRDYGVDGQIGLEETPEAYVAALVEVFREARRVLRSDGTFWLNLGDSYSSGGRGTHGAHAAFLGKPQADAQAMGPKKTPGYGDKQLLMIPARVALALQADGWIVRSDIIWHKPNCMPESVQDRPTKSHEYLFLLTKSSSYFYDADAIKEDAQDWGTRDRSDGKYTSGNVPISGGAHHGLTGISKQDAVGKRTYTGFNDRYFAEPHELKRNKRSVWTISTTPYSGAHFAVMPEALVEPCILAGCPLTTGAGFGPGLVLDMFMGSGTVARVARRLGRNYIGSELSPDYVAMARESLRLPFESHYIEPNNDLSELPMFTYADQIQRQESESE